ncbi:MAG: branched-chain amino acid ABC transporter permease [Oscillospiraceae bacterium]|jgi:branched-chain amino acid transport system permease protein|nr:branched-chain amino acid ABC transporter permease [Oscillospiraceae bacterium]MCI8716302.1 branched-chain amino acid ABC transporter permease [Oscillospiraceae bacterium]
MNKVKSLKPSTRQNLISYTLVIAAFLVIQLLLGQGMLSRSIQGQLVPICCYIVMALSLNLVVGISGELSLGHAGFMSVGAFSGVAAAVSLQGSVGSPAVRLVIAIAVGAVLAAAAGFIVGVPALRLQGDYLAIVTLAFGQIIVNILQCVYLGVDGEGLHFNFLDAELHMEDGISIISGPKGTVSVTRIASFTAGFLLILVTLAVVQNLVNSRAGRAIMAARDNRIAAGSVGVNVTKYKLMAFVTAAALAGAAGALYGLNYSSVAPSKFDYNTSILVLVFVVLGGLGNMWGSIIAAAFLTALPETPAMRGLADYRMLVYAVVLILVMLGTNNPAVQDFLNTKFRRRKKRKEGAGK